MTTSTALLSGFDTALPQLHQPARVLDAARDALIKEFVAVHNKRKQTRAQVSFGEILESGIHLTLCENFTTIADNLVLQGDDLKINTSAWAEQRNQMRDAPLEQNSKGPTAGARRPSDDMQGGAVTSNKRHKQHEGQSASSAQALSLPVPVPLRNLRSQKRRF